MALGHWLRSRAGSGGEGRAGQSRAEPAGHTVVSTVVSLDGAPLPLSERAAAARVPPHRPCVPGEVTGTLAPGHLQASKQGRLAAGWGVTSPGTHGPQFVLRT